MNGEQLYALIKRALNYFDLRFNQMDELIVSIENDSIVFSYKNESLKWKVPK